VKGLFKFTVIVLFLVSLILFSFNLSFAQETCQIARPWYGSINCEEYPEWSSIINVPDGHEYQCNVPTCEVSSFDSFVCDKFGTVYNGIRIKKGSSIVLDCSTNALDATSLNCKTGNVPLTLHTGDIIIVDFWCKALIGDEYNPSNSYNVQVRYKPIMLKLHYDSGEGFQSNTEDCSLNPVWNTYWQKQPTDTNRLETISKDITSTPVQFSNNYGLSVPGNVLGPMTGLTPKKLTAGQSYWLVYDWVTRPDLIVKYYQNIPVWCNVVDHSLTKFEKITTQSSSCYYIPTSRLSETVDCCSSSECQTIYNEQSIQCTDDFRCGYTKSCYSDYDCGSTAATCQSEIGNYYLIKSVCDKSRLDSYEKGKCSSSKEKVKCCTGQDGGPNTCESGYYCDYEEGCQIILQNCPAGKCCSIGGKFIQQSCQSGLVCCPTADPMIGDCKKSCQPEVQEQPPQTSKSTGTSVKIPTKTSEGIVEIGDMTIDSQGNFDVPLKIGPVNVGVKIGSQYKEVQDWAPFIVNVIGICIKICPSLIALL